ncbi:FHA domain-containing protein [Succinimonas sp.]|uniref:FHA domain-containing protein n=1 Tax=Succinimonas sp. TaxID=1936151 RepID=UPI00386B8B78
MARVKICPKCGAENSPGSAFCINENCGWDLSGVKSVDKEAPKPAPDPDPGEKAPEDNAVPPGKDWAKICPKCGRANRVVAKQCVACHENLKFLIEKTLVDKSLLQGSSGAPAPEPAAPKPVNKVIASLNAPDGRCILKIDTLHPITVIGRENVMADYLASRDYTSRLHAEIHVMGDRLAFVDKGKNGTYINNVKMSPGSTEVLKDGDKVSMGDRWPDDWTKSQAGCFIVAYETGV